MVSISILTYNGEKFITYCLESVLKQTYKNVEILVIDNNSIDKTREIIIEFQEIYKFKTLFNNENLGFSAGHNLGIKNSRGEFILCLNQDVILDENFIEEAIRIFETDKRIGSVQGKLYKLTADFKKTNIVDTTGLVMFKNRRVINRDQGLLDNGNLRSESEEIFGVDGAAPIYRKEALEDVKLSFNGNEYFDEDFFIYKEDVDLAWRMRIYGWKAVYAPKAIAYHLRSAGDSAAMSYLSILKERRKIKPLAKYYSFRNQRLMQIKNEFCILFLKHFIWFFSKEVLAWTWALIFEEPQTIKAIISLFFKIPKILAKRFAIMNKKKISSKDLEKWFV